MRLYVALNYGDEDPAEAGGGEDLVVGPLDHVGMLRTDLHLEDHEGEVDACLQTDGGVVPYNGIYYSEWAVVTDEETLQKLEEWYGKPQPLIGGDHKFPETD